jgi:hypothetical protein
MIILPTLSPRNSPVIASGRASMPWRSVSTGMVRPDRDGHFDVEALL